MSQASRVVLVVAHPRLAFERLGGLTILERQLFTLARAGAGKVWIAMPKPDAAALCALRLPPGLDLSWSHRSGLVPGECEPPYLTLSGDHLLRLEALRGILSAEYAAHSRMVDAEGRTVVQAVPFRSETIPPAHEERLSQGAFLHLRIPAGQGSSLDWLMASGGKSQDGFMARNFDRHISLALSRFLLDTRVTPNMMTLFSCALGLFGTVFFLNPNHHAMSLAGACLIWLHSVLDGCDGELARLKFLESPLGADIDFWGDNLVHLSLFGCLAWGFHKADHSLLPLILGTSACLGALGSARLAYVDRRSKRQAPALSSPVGGSATALQRLETILAQRDFIYLLLLLAYFDKTYEFLWAGAVGSVLFLIMMMKLRRSPHEHPQTRLEIPSKIHS